jgi:hypothetical protein
MKLSLKQKAILQTIGMFAGAVVIAHLVTFIIQNVSTEVLANVAGFGFIGFFGYMFYQITLNRLEYNEKLKEFAKKD